ncbi:MAG TPA: DNA-deoxyinosine glycosylase [Cellvibrionaceae bacterium]
MENWKEGLAPIIGEQSRVLILGSLPGDMSLQKQQYYGNPRNHFWPILAALFDCNPGITYEEKKQFILNQRLALWDVLKAADRRGSLDSNIRDAIPNDLQKLLSAYPNIGLIALNGGEASRKFRAIRKRYTDVFVNIECIELPSTSNIPGKNVLPLPEKIQRWSQIKSALTGG